MQFFGYRDKASKNAPADRRAHATEAEIKSAYDHGRRDERARRRRSPLLTLLVAFVAIVGVGILALAAREGSFGRGGQVVDRQLTVAAGEAGEAGREAAAATGATVREAGETLRERAGDAG